MEGSDGARGVASGPPQAGPPAAPRGPVNFLALCLFWPAFALACLPLLLYTLARLLDGLGASSSTVQELEVGAAYGLILATLPFGLGALVLGLIALATRPRRD